MIKAHLHRFGDCIALTVGDDFTRYLTPAEALAMAQALTAYAEDVRAVHYLNSREGSRALALDTSGYNGRDFKQSREA